MVKADVARCDVILPVFNAPEATRRCLEALARHTPAEACVVLVDDASTDPRIAPMLARFAASRTGSRVITRAANGGFVAAVNEALAATASDAIVLNSDTEVTAGWFDALLRCRDSDPVIGLACPLSNHATILTIEGIGTLLARPDGTPDADAIGACVRRASVREYPRLPTAVGFCMLVRRAVLDRCGDLDPVYGRGYGEECDLSMRALDAGFEIACCDDAYVQHAGGASFGGGVAMDSERAVNRSRLVRRWPAYEPGVRAWLRRNPLRPAIERVQAEAERARFPGRPRVLQVLHRFGTIGGVEEHVRTLVNALKDDAVFTLVWPQDLGGSWADMAVERLAPHVRLVRVAASHMTAGIRVIGLPAAVDDAPMEEAFGGLLAGRFDVVHFQSLVGWNTLRLPALARAAGSRVVVSAHDLGMLCADYNMALEPGERPCGRKAARGTDSGCVACLRGKSDAVLGAQPPPPVSVYLEARHAAASDAVRNADWVICPSAYLGARLQAGFGEVLGAKLRIIGHGAPDFAPLEHAPRLGVLRVAFLGRFGERKGAHVLAEAARQLAGERISFEVHGPVEPSVAALARESGLVLRGEYTADELPRRLQGVDLVVVPTLLEESFCLVVTEAQRLGIPVAASRLGAIPERIVEGETGFLLPPGDVAAMVRLLVRLRHEPRSLAEVAKRLRASPPRTIAAQAAEYLSIYRGLAAYPIAAPASAPRDGAALVRSAFGLPRARIHSALGHDHWERRLDYESRVAVEARELSTGIAVICLPGAHPGIEGETLRALRAQSPAVPVTVIPWDADEAEVLRHSRSAIEGAGARHIVVLEAGDVPAPGALAALSAALDAHGETVLAYGDEESMSRAGERYDPLLKPAFDVELLRHRPYIAGVCAIDRARLLAMGGLRFAGWAGVVDLAFRIAETGVPRAVVHAPQARVRRLDANQRRLGGRRFHEIAAEHLSRCGRAATLQPASAEAAAWWRYPAPNEPVAVLLHVADPRQGAWDGAEAMLRAAGAPIDTLFVTLDGATARRLALHLQERGAVVEVVAVPLQGALAVALERSTSPWLAVVDARCSGFQPGWLARLREGVGDAAGACADVSGPAGQRIAGWDVLGAGPESIAGAPPAAVEGALADIYGAPRSVAALSPRFALLRREVALAALAPGDLVRAGQHGMAHISLALREAGARLVSRPWVAAGLRAVDSPPAPDIDARWMRQRWGAALDSDPTFHESLALSGPCLEPEILYVPRGAGAIARPRIAAFPFDRWGSGEARVRRPCEALERAGLAEVLLMPEHTAGRVPNRREWSRVDADAVLAHNFFHDWQLDFLRDGMRRGRGPIVLGMDDLLTDLPPGNPYARTLYPDIAARIARAAAQCDRLVVTSDALARAYGPLAPEVRVIPNALDAARWEGLANAPRAQGRPRIGWAGARQHRDDLLLLLPVMAATWREIDWVFLGMCPDEMRPMAREVHSLVDVGRFPARLAALGLDIAVAPLVDHPFNRAKSALKVLEYGMLGLPVVCSDLDPYRDAPVKRVGTDPAEWIDALRALAADPDRAHTEGARLRAWVLRHGTLTSTRDLWYNALTDGPGRKAA